MSSRTVAFASVCFAGATLVACQASTATAPAASLEQCAAVTPHELPSGSLVGSPSMETDDTGIVRTTWGSGRDSVTIFSAFFRYASPDPTFERTPAPNSVRGQPATILEIGPEGPDPVVGFAWNDGTCAWAVHLGPGNTRDDAVDYAARF